MVLQSLHDEAKRKVVGILLKQGTGNQGMERGIMEWKG